MSILNTKQLIDCELEGRVRNYVWRKAPSQSPGTGVWLDSSMSPGNPPSQYFIGSAYTATAMARSTEGGLNHGPNVSPASKYLRSMTAMTSTATALPMTIQVCDYLMFYPFIDMSEVSEVAMTNTTTLPRYTDGKGVQVTAVLTNAGVGGVSFFFTYTNSDGVSGRVSNTVNINTSTGIGTIVCSGVAAATLNGNPFIGLQGNDTGVRSIESITMNSADVGLFALVLMKPLGIMQINETTAPYEKDFMLIGNDLPRIYDDAFLGMLFLPRGSTATSTFIGDIKVIWDN